MFCSTLVYHIHINIWFFTVRSHTCLFLCRDNFRNTNSSSESWNLNIACWKDCFVDSINQTKFLSFGSTTARLCSNTTHVFIFIKLSEVSHSWSRHWTVHFNHQFTLSVSVFTEYSYVTFVKILFERGVFTKLIATSAYLRFTVGIT